MSRLFPMLLALPLAGCFPFAIHGSKYDCDESACDDDGDEEDAPEDDEPQRPGDRPDEDTDTERDTADRGDTGTVRPDPSVGPILVDPTSAPAGTLEIVVLSGRGTDWSRVTDVRFLSPDDVAITAQRPRGTTEYVVSIDVPGDAALGARDILVTLDDGTARWLDDGFEITQGRAQP